MARCPAAEWRPIPVNFDVGGCHPRLIVLHIMQGTLNGTDSWFRNPAAQVSAHFGTGRDGRLYQWVDTANMAWHAADANSFGIGIENEGQSGDKLTAAQIAAVAKVCAWAQDVHRVPLQVCNDVNGRGLAYHALGGVAWGNHPDCPGAPVVAQRGAILAAAHAPVPVSEEEDDMVVLDNLATGGPAVALVPPAGKTVLVLAADGGFGGHGAPQVRVGFHPWGTGAQDYTVSWPDPVKIRMPSGVTNVTIGRVDEGNTPVTVSWA